MPAEEFPVFDIALSFAGEDRDLVSQVARHLVDDGVAVFYDQYFEHLLLGSDLVSTLREIYGKRATYCAVFMSDHYASKMYPNRVELPAILAKSAESPLDYLLPIRLHETQIAGILPTTATFDARGKSARDIASLLLKKLGVSHATPTEAKLFSRLVLDPTFIGSFVSLFCNTSNRTWGRYDMGLAALERFNAREAFGLLLQSYGLATVDTNLHDSETDYYLSVELSVLGRRFRKHLSSQLAINGA